METAVQEEETRLNSQSKKNDLLVTKDTFLWEKTLVFFEHFE